MSYIEVDVEGYISKTNISKDLQELLKAAEIYVDRLVNDPSLDLTYENNELEKFQINLHLNSEDGTSAGFSLDNPALTGTVKIPALGQSGSNRIPVAGITGYDSRTFMTYDTSVAASHETGHIILGALGMNGGVNGGQELGVAILAAVGREAIAKAKEQFPDGGEEFYLAIASSIRAYFGLDSVPEGQSTNLQLKPEMLVIAQQPDSSYENIYNSEVLKLYEQSGLSVSPSSYRKGYIAHAAYAEPHEHGHWQSIPSGDSDIDS